jgi:hypothetical protein
MILFITPSLRASECAAALEVATGHSVRFSPSLQEAASLLRSQEYEAIVLDQGLMEADPEQGELVLQHVGTAIPIYVNCAISNKERVVREVSAALRRWEREKTLAGKAAEQALLGQLREPLTAMLLECELLLSARHSAPTSEKLRALNRLAREIADRLEMSALASSGPPHV